MFQRKLAYWSTYTVVRWQLLLGLLGCWAAWKWLSSTYRQPDSEHWEVLEQFIPVAGWLLLGIASFSVLTAFVAWGWFLVRTKKNGAQARLRIGEGNRAEAGPVRVYIELPGVLRPLFGQVQARLVFRNLELSSVILLDQNVRATHGLIRAAIAGAAPTDLYDRGAHEVEEIQVLFVDPLRLLLLPYTIATHRQLLTLPQTMAPSELKVEPNRTEQQLERIQTPKRVEGEFLSYKDFEAGDDVRRIVWKIYARNGELVVRIPETTDPYASHLVLYASFYEGLNGAADDRNSRELLNAYKDQVRQLLDTAKAGSYDVRLPADQPEHTQNGESAKEQQVLRIGLAHWQSNLKPTQFVNPRDAALVCLSSATPMAEVAHLLQLLPAQVPVVVVKLSTAIPTLRKLRWHEFFFRRIYRPAERLRSRWTFSGHRTKLVDNEAQLEMLLHQRGNARLIDAPSL